MIQNPKERGRKKITEKFKQYHRNYKKANFKGRDHCFLIFNSKTIYCNNSHLFKKQKYNTFILLYSPEWQKPTSLQPLKVNWLKFFTVTGYNMKDNGIQFCNFDFVPFF